MTLPSIGILLLSLAHAAEPASALPVRFLPSETFYAASPGHGPDKPPPSDGYEFKSKKGGNFLAKLGLVAIAAGGVTTLSSLGQEPGSAVRTVRAQSGAGLIGAGVVLIAIERAR
jgi:hypothetical protein